MELPKRITITMRGMDEDDGDVRFNDFVQELENVKKALLETQKLLSNEVFAYFKVVELQKNSPLQVVVEAVPLKLDYENVTDHLVESFFSNITNIKQGIYPSGFTYETFNAYKDLISLRDKKRITEISISQNGETKDYLPNFSQKIDEIMGKDEFEYGTYTGNLEAINIHHQNIFYLYPTNHLPKLKCIFQREHKDKAVQAVGKYVTVIGKKKSMSRINGFSTYEMLVDRIEIHPDEKDVPTLRSLRGIMTKRIEEEGSGSLFGGMYDEW